jgi:hypothetical protein
MNGLDYGGFRRFHRSGSGTSFYQSIPQNPLSRKEIIFGRSLRPGLPWAGLARHRELSFVFD